MQRLRADAELRNRLDDELFGATALKRPDGVTHRRVRPRRGKMTSRGSTRARTDSPRIA